MKQRVATLLACGLLLGATSASARADDLGSLFRVNEADPKANIPNEEARNAHPVEFGYYLQDLILRAEEAFNKKDWDGAIKYWDALANAVPDRPMSFRRLCSAYEGKGEMLKAEGACWAALSRQGVLVEDYLHFVRLVLKQFRVPDNTKITEMRTQMVDASLGHLRVQLKALPNPEVKEDTGESGDKNLPLPVQVEMLGCRLAALLNDGPRLTTCVTNLKAVGADPRLILPFNWAAATTSGDEKAVAGALADARRAGLSEQTLKAMSDGTSQFAAQRALNEARFKAEQAAAKQTVLRDRLLQMGGALIGLLTLGGLGWFFSRRGNQANGASPGNNAV